MTNLIKKLEEAKKKANSLTDELNKAFAKLPTSKELGKFAEKETSRSNQQKSQDLSK